MGIFLFIAVVVLVAFFVIAAINAHTKKQSLTSAIQAIQDFAGAEVLVRGSFGLACNASASKYAVAWGAAEAPRAKTIPADALMGVEIERIGEVTKTKRSGFGNTISTSAGAKEVNLCVKFRDTELPVVRFPLYIRLGDNDYGEQAAVSEARKWETAILAVAHSAKPLAQASYDDTPSQITNSIPSISLAQEIANLRQLMIEGTLSEAEFEQAKAKALSR